MLNLLRWAAPWEFSPSLLLALGLLALLYLRHARQASALQRCAFWGGLALVYLVSQTDFDYYAEHEFFVHRLQHLVLHHLGPFLMVIGTPVAGFVSLAQAIARKDGRYWTVLRRLGRGVGWALQPWASAALFNLLALFWLIPAIHFPAMIDWRLYRVMNASVLINGLLFWAAVLRGAAPGHVLPDGPASRGGPLGAPARICLMAAVVPVQIAMGALIFFAPVELYPVYSLCGRAFAGLTALQDQQIGGLILWVPGAMMSVLGILLVIAERFSSPVALRP